MNNVDKLNRLIELAEQQHARDMRLSPGMKLLGELAMDDQAIKWLRDVRQVLVTDGMAAFLPMTVGAEEIRALRHN